MCFAYSVSVGDLGEGVDDEISCQSRIPIHACGWGNVMTTEEMRDILLRNMADFTDLKRQVGDLVSAHSVREQRVGSVLADLRKRLGDYLDSFDRDRYKATDDRLLISSLAIEVAILDKLGYDLGTPDGSFLSATAALLDGRNSAALDHFRAFLQAAAAGNRNIANAHYLSGMIFYNRRNFTQAIDSFANASKHSPRDNPDWQSRIYVAELMHFRRDSKEEIDKAFFDVESDLKSIEKKPAHNLLRATLYLKWGNCYVGTFLDPREPNRIVNNPVATGYFKQARRWCPHYAGSDSLLPAIIDYSLAQSLLLSDSVDMELGKTPSELFRDVFDRLRRIVLRKREEIILAQTYFMLGTCAHYSSHISKDVGEIYLEYARHQTLTVPSDVCFYSCITKELLGRDEFVKQIDFYADQFEGQAARRMAQ
jgi:tetratricopeptide (TPR) repeat protein